MEAVPVEHRAGTGLFVVKSALDRAAEAVAVEAAVVLDERSPSAITENIRVVVHIIRVLPLALQAIAV